ncbi:uncharacterized protein LOC118278943 isoform X8 [Spodoptera frugiperda]|uniref:Uncharacterized protein LOC118278943 isoform X8 n=1 Tax=Spodoptera frugiperda TaxID=7108 RepID=A0A9R0E670_SPOFR|nr:uncharacterized protein LOC118278943 isoform X8 [Spodoptera frugiperda]
MKCVNCGLAIQRLQRHLVSSLSARHQSRLSCWLSNAQTQLPLDALICQPCFLLLDTEAGEHERLLGHTMVCVGCGKSVRKIRHHNVNMECPLLAVLISQNTYYVPSRNNYVCHMCWMRANRLAVVDSTCDMQELASDNMQDLASNNNAAAPPDVQETSRHERRVSSPEEYFHTQDSSSDSLIDDPSEEKHEASADKIRCPKCSTEIETKQYVQLPLDALICQPCFLLLDTEAGEHERLLGHTMVCVGCGKSVRRIKQYHNVNMECPLLAVLISQNTYYVPSRNNYVCHMCWIRANRQAVVDSTHDMQELASDNMQDLASNNNAAAPPDVQEDRVNAILVNVYKYFATEGTELSPSQLRERTALCTGASEADVECALVLHQEVSATQKPLRKPPRKRRKKESKSPPPIQEEEPYIERETLIVTVDPKAGDANSEINPLAIKEEQPSSPITCEQDASLCEPQQSGLKPEDMAKVFVKTEPTEEPNS